jgi:hypothetical protein
MAPYRRNERQDDATRRAVSQYIRAEQKNEYGTNEDGETRPYLFTMNSSPAEQENVARWR